jgi:hypothetical protein
MKREYRDAVHRTLITQYGVGKTKGRPAHSVFRAPMPSSGARTSAARIAGRFEFETS